MLPPVLVSWSSPCTQNNCLIVQLQANAELAVSNLKGFFFPRPIYYTNSDSRCHPVDPVNEKSWLATRTYFGSLWASTEFDVTQVPAQTEQLIIEIHSCWSVLCENQLPFCLPHISTHSLLFMSHIFMSPFLSVCSSLFSLSGFHSWTSGFILWLFNVFMSQLVSWFLSQIDQPWYIQAVFYYYRRAERKRQNHPVMIL